MPPYRFAGPYPMTYPETRDTSGRILGLVGIGARRDLGEAPDRWWHEDPDGTDGTQEDGAAQPETPSGEAAPPAPDGPVPAPPAVAPGA
jgi:hypothetical protein